MQIIIVGCGNVGTTLAEQLSKEGHNITIVDEKETLVRHVSNMYDVMGLVGNGASFAVQTEAGVHEADLLIAVTGADELNLLCCLIAKKAGNCHTIARVSNPVYSREINFIREELGLSMIINPKFATAMEMARILKFPSALKIDTFTKGRIELIKFRVEENSVLCDVKLKDLGQKLHCDVLVCTVERNEKVFIPDGNFELKARDEITIAGSPSKNIIFFKKMKMATARARHVLLVGGGETSYYLAAQLIDMGIQVKVVERDEKRCEELSELLPQAMVIQGDGTDKDLLLEEGLTTTEAFVAMTNFDEENIMLTLFAKSLTKAKLITKVHRVSYDEIIDELQIGSVIYPKYITAESIIRYVRAMHNSMGSNIETLYRMNDNRVEALEFLIKEDCPIIGIPLQEISLKPNILICSINHKGSITMAQGRSVIQAGDTVVLVTTTTGFHDIRDILK